MSHLVQDVRFAFRTLSKSPMFLVVALLSLSLGIGANTAIFTLVDQFLLRLLPVKDPKQLVLLWGRGDHYGSNNGRYKLSYPMYSDFRKDNSVFSGMFGTWDTSMSLSFEGKTERISGELVTGSFFPVLGVGSAIGRVFTDADDVIPEGHPIGVLSYAFWQSRFGGNPDIIGKKLTVNGYPIRVIGVSKAGFQGMDPGYTPQIRIPIMMKHTLDSFSGDFYSLTKRRARWVSTFGRLKPGESMKQAQAGLQPLFHQMLDMEVQEKEFAKAAPLTKQNFLKMSLELIPASTGGYSFLRDQYSKPLLVLTAIVGLVLLIACANVANLLIARATSRQKEIALRLALGASRGRIVSQLLVESLILAFAGGGIGLALAVWMDDALLGFLPQGASPLAISSSPDWRILAFNFGVAALTGIIFGLVPALQAARPDVAPTLKDEVGSIAGGAGAGMRKGLVAAQVMLSLLLLIGAGLFIRSLRNLKDLDPGFQTRNLLTFSVNPTSNGYKKERSAEFYRQLKESLDASPGVGSSAFAVVALIDNDEWDSSVTVESYKTKPGEWIDPHMNYVSADFFKTIDVPILAGREFRASDGAGAPMVAIVNEKFARRYFGGTNAVGKHMGMGGDPGTKLDITVVGVVRDTKYEDMRTATPEEMYIPYAQTTFQSGLTFYVRTARNPEQTFTTIRRLENLIDPNVPVYAMRTLEKQMDDSLVTERLVASLSSGFGLLATLLAGIGLYGVMAYMVARRTREIGIRVALGASSGTIVWLVMKEVLMLAGIGIGIGLPAAWILTRFVQTQLYGIAPDDPRAMAFATLGILLIMGIAGYVPARRAMRVDPMRALRWE